MKTFEFEIKFHWSLFLMVQLTIFKHWFSQWLGVDQATSHYLNQWWLDHWRIYPSLGLNELMSTDSYHSVDTIPFIYFSYYHLTQYDIIICEMKHKITWWYAINDIKLHDMVYQMIRAIPFEKLNMKEVKYETNVKNLLSNDRYQMISTTWCHFWHFFAAENKVAIWFCL